MAEPDWKPMMGLSIDVYDRVNKESEALCFTNVFGNMAREEIMMRQVKSLCSQAHNTFHESVGLSVIIFCLPTSNVH